MDKKLSEVLGQPFDEEKSKQSFSDSDANKVFALRSARPNH